MSSFSTPDESALFLPIETQIRLARRAAREAEAGASLALAPSARPVALAEACLRPADAAAEEAKSTRGALSPTGRASTASAPRLPPRAADALIRARLGEAEVRRALATLVRRWVPEQEVEDVLQETYLQALSTHALPRSAEDIEPWLRVMARRKATDALRQRFRDRGIAPRSAREAERDEQGADGAEAAPLEPCAADEEPELGDGGRAMRRAQALEPGVDPRDAMEAHIDVSRLLAALPPKPWAEQAVGWMLRQAEGERVDDLALGEGVSRARIYSRLGQLRALIGAQAERPAAPRASKNLGCRGRRGLDRPGDEK